MALRAHTFGPSCRLYTDSNEFTRRASVLSRVPPKLKAHFFYSSPLPIDDPLSPLPPPLTGTSVAASRVPPRPFSVYDNAALEEAWLGLQRSFKAEPDAGVQNPITQPRPDSQEAISPVQPQDFSHQTSRGKDDRSRSKKSEGEHLATRFDEALKFKDGTSLKQSATKFSDAADLGERLLVARHRHKFTSLQHHHASNPERDCGEFTTHTDVVGLGLEVGSCSAGRKAEVEQHPKDSALSDDLDQRSSRSFSDSKHEPLLQIRDDVTLSLTQDGLSGVNLHYDNHRSTENPDSPKSDLPRSLGSLRECPKEKSPEFQRGRSRVESLKKIIEGLGEAANARPSPACVAKLSTGTMGSPLPMNLVPSINELGAPTVDSSMTVPLVKSDSSAHAERVDTELDRNRPHVSSHHDAEHGDQKDGPAEAKNGRASKSSIVKDHYRTSNIAQAGTDLNPTVILSDDREGGYTSHVKPIDAEKIRFDGVKNGTSRRKHRLFHRKRHCSAEDGRSDGSDSQSPPRPKSKRDNAQYGSSPAERDTTGTPFLRAPSRHRRSFSSINDSSTPHDPRTDVQNGHGYHRKSALSQPLNSEIKSKDLDAEASEIKKTKAETVFNPDIVSQAYSESSKLKKAFVPVGLSCLHLVEMPELEMKPIYWSPVHDISSVLRGTWFYKETMLPVEADVANQLEAGYKYMEPWTQTYVDEMNACLEIGPEAEFKLVHKLWPAEEPPNADGRTGSSNGNNSIQRESEQVLPTQQVHQQELVLDIQTTAAGTGKLSSEVENVDSVPLRLYARSSIIFASSKDAQILRPNLLPSVARGRKPLGPIRKGRTIGVPVVRGFDHKAWDKLYPPSKGTTSQKPQSPITISNLASSNNSAEREACSACSFEEKRPKATDLILVIHGIGQKLSERVESFRFTHSINSFRRRMNVELETDSVQPWMRPDLGSIMVLPVNWRSTLSLEDEDLSLSIDGDSQNPEKSYTLKDITAETIPAVRNLISDVMLDIPYYLSHHKPKMIEAVVKEANRIYRLWCENNPGFEATGRVHLIAHSLGSVMALDILSQQPSTLTKQLVLNHQEVSGKMFEFDTKNLFFCGSPAGFFLLLNHAQLVPRKGRAKPGTTEQDAYSSVGSDAGTYGCLAVDNVYNIMHRNDPIAYRVNACVDVDYALSLHPASVPSATSGWFEAIGHVFRSKSISAPHGFSNLETLPTRPTIAKMPSTIEMDTHNFTQEEIAERKMYLLNDNGQIDYYLSSGGGPLEFQYLNMLSAHSSYWVLQDFARFLVVEIGRKPGQGDTVPGMRAVKKSWGRK